MRVRRVEALAIVALVVAAFALRAGLIAQTPGYQPRHDDHDYVRVAWSMAAGRGYPEIRVRLPGHHVRHLADGWRPPLWPALMAVPLRAAGGAIGPLPRHVPQLTALRLLNALLGAVAVLLTALLARRLFGARAGWWAGALAVVYLPLALLSTVLLSETLFVCLELGALLVALPAGSVPRAVAAGALVGLAWLTRMNGVLLLAPVVLLVAASGTTRARVVRAGAAVLACAAVVSPWTIRNAEQLHAFVPVSTETGGTLLGTYNSLALHDRRDPGAWHPLRGTWWGYRHLVPPGTPPAVANTRLTSVALDFASDHPRYIATVVSWNVRRMLGLAGQSRWRFEAATADIGPRAADAAMLCFWVVALLAATALASGAARGVPRALWLAPALLIVSVLLVNAETPRFRAPLEPFLLVLAGVALSRIGRRGHRRLSRWSLG